MHRQLVFSRMLPTLSYPIVLGRRSKLEQSGEQGIVRNRRGVVGGQFGIEAEMGFDCHAVS
jgi:hypothetical protein